MGESPKLDLIDDLRRIAERDFDATVKHGAVVDDKAQKTGGMAGLFLAAAFGFAKPESLVTLRDQYGISALGLLYLALLLFVVTVLFCLRAMWLKDLPSTGVSLETQDMSAQFLLQLEDSQLDEEMMLAYRSNKIEIWKATIAQRLAANVVQTRLVHRAQRALTGGILVSALSLGLLGYAARNAVPLKQEKPMQEKTITPPKKPAVFVPGSGKGHPMTREAVLRTLQSKEFISEQLKRIPRIQ